MKKYITLMLISLLMVLVFVGCSEQDDNKLTDDIIKQYDPWGLKYKPEIGGQIDPVFADKYYDYIRGCLAEYMNMSQTSFGAPRFRVDLSFDNIGLLEDMREIADKKRGSLEYTMFVQAIDYDRATYAYDKMIAQYVDNLVAEERNMLPKYPEITSDDTVFQQYETCKQLMLDMLNSYFINQ